MNWCWILMQANAFQIQARSGSDCIFGDLGICQVKRIWFHSLALFSAAQGKGIIQPTCSPVAGQIVYRVLSTNACEKFCMSINTLSLRVIIQLARLPVYLVCSCNTTVAKFRGRCSLLLINLVFSNLLPALCTARNFGTVCNDISIKCHEFVPKSDFSHFWCGLL